MIGNIGFNNAVALAGKMLRPESSAALPGVDLNPAGAIGASDATLRLGNLESTGAAKSSSFANVIDRAVGEVDGKMKAAATDQAKVMSGETNNLHQAMISMQEASVAFSLMVEVRNKLVDSYQELMRMQV